MSQKWDAAASKASANVGCINRCTMCRTREQQALCTVQNKSGPLWSVQGVTVCKRKLFNEWTGPEGSNMEQGLGTKSEEKQTRGWGVPGLDTELSYLQIFEGWPIEEKGISVQFQKLLESKFSLLKKKFFWCWKMQKFFWCCLQMQKKKQPPTKTKKSYLVRIYTSLYRRLKSGMTTKDSYIRTYKAPSDELIIKTEPLKKMKQYTLLFKG